MHLAMSIMYLHGINTPNIFCPVDLQPQDLPNWAPKFTPGFSGVRVTCYSGVSV